ncbi:MAG: DUF3990 domain-containing protein [Planctomycetaceae bacterium]|nr:DUF3990 domain-containing protein [Planctomycetaceae bacterium]
MQTPQLKSASYERDFGQGFYCTENLSQAEHRAKRFATLIVNTYQFVLLKCSGDWC